MKKRRALYKRISLFAKRVNIFLVYTFCVLCVHITSLLASNEALYLCVLFVHVLRTICTHFAYYLYTCGKLLLTDIGVFRRLKRRKRRKSIFICNRHLSSKTEN